MNEHSPLAARRGPVAEAPTDNRPGVGTVAAESGSRQARLRPAAPYRYQNVRARLRLLQWALVAADGLAIVAGFAGAHALHFGTLDLATRDITFIASTVLLAIAFLQSNRAYTLSTIKDANAHINALAMAIATTVAVVMLIGFAVGYLETVSRSWFGLSAALAVGLMLGGRLIAGQVVLRVREKGVLRERVAIVGVTNPTEQILDRLRSDAGSDVQVLGLFDDRLRRVPAAVGAVQVVGDTDDLMALLRAEPLDRIIVALPWAGQTRMKALLSKLRQCPVRLDVALSPPLWETASDLERVAGVPVLTVANYHVEHQMGLLKRLEDIVLAGLMLLALSPLMLTVAAIIRLTSAGPALYRQDRYGFNNQLFSIYKFRSMYTGPVPDDGARQARRDDPRITPIGRFIRRTSIDELPQLLNVLKGEMSVVGPRPHAVPHNEMYGRVIDQYFARHNVRPGITGWAQVNGLRGETDTDDKMRKRVEYDIAYIESWSVLFDIKIILLTALRVWRQKTAY